MAKIRVLVVDDSYFIRKTLSKLISNDNIEVVDTAANGLEAVQKVASLKPDLVTMDIEMPVMDGLTAVKEIMKSNPVPIIMVSTLTSNGADATMEALANGAVEFVTKTASFNDLGSIKEDLLCKIASVSKSSLIINQIRSKNHLLQMKKALRSGFKDTVEVSAPTKTIIEKSNFEYKLAVPQFGRKPRSSELSVMVIGISTGGPAALQEIIPYFSADIPVPILIVQHMPALFTKSLAERLNAKSKLNIKEAEHGEKIMHGNVYIAPGGKQMTINSNMQVVISDEPANELFKPSVNVLGDSLVNTLGSRVLCLMMTGMGHDGGDAFQKLHSKGAYIMVQDPETCVVAGMVKTVLDLNIANEIVPLHDLPTAIASIFGVR